jgi:hypothetical protein
MIDFRNPETPRRNPNIFASRCWEAGGITIAAVAVYGGTRRWQCMDQGCTHLITPPVAEMVPECMHDGVNRIILLRDWTAFIVGIRTPDYRETAENWATTQGAKMSEEEAESIFRKELSANIERMKLVYRS